MKARPPSAGNAAPADVPAARHWGGFVLGGAAAFVTDSAVSMLLARSLDVPLLIARLVAISIAMAVSWSINRTITFPVTAPPSLTEFARFAAVAWGAAAVNYIIFAGLIIAYPGLHPVAAIAVASLFAMVVAYLGMRFGVFRRARRQS